MNHLRRSVLGALALCATLAAASASYGDEDTANEHVQLVLSFLNDQDKDIRALAFAQVRTQSPGGAATERFAAQLAGLPADGQIGLLGALADRGDKAARPALLDLLAQTSDAQVTIAATKALGPLGNSKDLPLLVERLGSESPGALQAAARSSLVRLEGDDVPQSIVDAMGHTSPKVQVELIEVLATRRALSATGALLQASLSGEAQVRRAAMTALGQLASAEDLPGLVRGVLRAEPGKEREAAEKEVMFVCARIADPPKRDALLLEALAQLPKADQTAMLSTLGRVGGPAALGVVEAAIASDDAEEHAMGVRALCNWPDASVAPRLIELVQEDGHEGDQIAALRALIRIAPLPDGRSDRQELELLKLAFSLATRDQERQLALKRAAAIRTPEALRFILPYVDRPPFAETACLSVVELAHHRGLREPNKAEFDRALDKVIAASKDAVVVDRARRYKKDETWVRPTQSQ
ncbi:hypothetical protein Pla175_26620 [Pirellulimonas nuda]|uniref:HEAT repeat protein n=1 Tax=Pirellulimonas nuda TaxID=2528009 RepID=A0A518DCR1_9BACT|nr:HEAT repeat domain-containing protein [Pirellulimonas nuda]QDU89274.1 hypothetical protein Pla175_26620 [Pirellulimonas nuda]